MANEMTITMELKRIDLCDLLLACWAAEKMSEGAPKWMELHDKLEGILKKFDEENGI